MIFPLEQISPWLSEGQTQAEPPTLACHLARAPIGYREERCGEYPVVTVIPYPAFQAPVQLVGDG